MAAVNSGKRFHCPYLRPIGRSLFQRRVQRRSLLPISTKCLSTDDCAISSGSSMPSTTSAPSLADDTSMANATDAASTANGDTSPLTQRPSTSSRATAAPSRTSRTRHRHNLRDPSTHWSLAVCTSSKWLLKSNITVTGALDRGQWQ